MEVKCLLNIFIIMFLFFSFIIFINQLFTIFNEYNHSTDILTIEPLENMPLMIGGNSAFCETHKGFDQETSCNSLTKSNCNSTSCCVWMNDGKCKAGNKSGPVFNSDSTGKSIPIKSYSFQNKCYGNGCSSSDN